MTMIFLIVPDTLYTMYLLRSTHMTHWEWIMKKNETWRTWIDLAAEPQIISGAIKSKLIFSEKTLKLSRKIQSDV